VLSVGFVAGCSDDADPVSSTDSDISASPSLSPDDCAGAIPDSAIDALGWRAGDPATVGVGRCQRDAGRAGEVTVALRAVPAVDQDRADAAQAAYDQLCGALDPALTEQDPAWITTGATACVQVLGDTETGAAEAVVLTDDDEVLQVRVAARQPTDAGQVQAGLDALVRGAATLA
jgi:hypothetical protein